jgi:hypothetical protein
MIAQAISYSWIDDDDVFATPTRIWDATPATLISFFYNCVFRVNKGTFLG